MRSRVLIAVSLVLLVGGVAVAGDSSEDLEKAPPLPTERIAGPDVTLASLRGEPVAINFWASWCTPCRREAPELQRLHRSRTPGTVVGVNWNDELTAARGFVRDYNLTFPILRDADGSVGNAYDIVGLPVTVIVDSRGRIAQLLNGPQTAATVRAAFEAAG